MAGISYRKRGKYWQYRFDAAKMGGKRNQVSCSGFPTKKEAVDAGTKAFAEYNSAGQVFKPAEISFADYLNHWMEQYTLLNCRDNTIANYRMIIENHLKPSLGAYRLSALSPDILQEFVNQKYATGLKKSTLSGIIGALSGSCKYAVFPLKYIKENPMAYVKSPKYTQSEEIIKVIAQKDFETILKRFEKAPHFKTMLMIGFYTGMRIGEVCGLTEGDIDFENNEISVNKILNGLSGKWYFTDPKTASSIRKVKIGNVLNSYLKRTINSYKENKLFYGQHFIKVYEQDEIIRGKHYRRVLNSGHPLPCKEVKPLCRKENGEIITPNSFKYAARIIHYELGIDFNFHSLRHTHATLLFENNANAKDIQARLGHSKLETTMDTYTQHRSITEYNG